MNVFPSFSLEYCLGLERETFHYWHRRAMEIFYATAERAIKDIPEIEDGKVDDDTFEKQEKRLRAKIDAIEKSKEGTING